MDSKKPLYKSIAFWIMVLLLLYSALGFFAVPFLIKNNTKSFVISKLNSTLTIEDLSFNPFFLSSVAKGVKLTDKDSTLWFKADSLLIDIDLWDTLSNNLSLAKITMNNPFFNVIMEKRNGITQIKYPKITPSRSQQQNKDIDIREITINNGSLNYNDKSGEKQLKLSLKEVNFSQRFFTTKDSDSRFNTSFKVNNSDTTKVTGIFNFSQLKLNAKWRLKNWETATLFTFISDKDEQFYGLSHPSGLINAYGSVFYQDQKKSTANIAIEKLKLSNFKTIHDSTQRFEIHELRLNNAQLDFSKGAVNIESIETQGGYFDVVFDRNNKFIWENKLSKTNHNKIEPKSPWLFELKKFSMEKSNIMLQKAVTNSANNNINIQNLTIKNISNTPNTALSLDSQLLINDNGTLIAKAKISNTPMNLSSNITINNIDISSFKSWQSNDLDFWVSKGKLSLQQDLKISNTVTSKGWINLDNFEIIDKQNNTIIALDHLKVQQFSLDSKIKTIKLNNIKLDKAKGNLSISPNKQFDIPTFKSKDEKPTKIQNNWIVEIGEVKFIDTQ